jgi:hypothetical protein
VKNIRTVRSYAENDWEDAAFRITIDPTDSDNPIGITFGTDDDVSWLTPRQARGLTRAITAALKEARGV